MQTVFLFIFLYILILLVLLWIIFPYRVCSMSNCFEFCIDIRHTKKLYVYKKRCHTIMCVLLSVRRVLLFLSQIVSNTILYVCNIIRTTVVYLYRSRFTTRINSSIRTRNPSDGERNVFFFNSRVLNTLAFSVARNDFSNRGRRIRAPKPFRFTVNNVVL